MPWVEVTTRELLADDVRANLARSISDTMETIEFGHPTENARKVDWIWFHTLPANMWAVGGQFDDTYARGRKLAFARIIAPEGFMNSELKARALIFLTTHYLEEADVLCDRIAIIDQGAVVAEGTPAELKQEVSGDVVSVVLNGSTSKAADLLAAEPYVWALEGQQADRLRLRVGDGASAIPLILRTLDSSGIELGAVELYRPSLDDVFLAKTGRSLRDA